MPYAIISEWFINILNGEIDFTLKQIYDSFEKELSNTLLSQFERAQILKEMADSKGKAISKIRKISEENKIDLKTVLNSKTSAVAQEIAKITFSYESDLVNAISKVGF